MPATSDASISGGDRFSIRLLSGGQFEIDERWNTADVRSNYWRLYCNAEAGAWLRLATGRYAITPGRLHFVPPWVHFTCHCGNAIEHTFVHFDTVGLPGAVIRDIFDRPRALPRDEALETTFRSAWAGESHALAFQLVLKGVVYHALARLIGQLPEHEATRCAMLAQGDHPVQPAVAYIEAHLNESMTNAALAAHCHFSEDHFIRRFRQITGQTPAQYIIERRVSRAANLLLFTSDSIEQIAERSGFPNRYYFTRVFAQRLGVSPAAYRQATRV